MKFPRRWASLVMLGLLASLTLFGLVGCGEEEEVDPYVYASLRQIMTGAVLDTASRNFTFEIDAPEFEYVKGNVGIIREGNRLEFLVGKDLEQIAPRLQGALLGVKMTFTPQPTHLVLERIKRGGQIVQDSIPKPEDYVLPKLLRAGAIDLEEPGAPLPDMVWNKRETIEQFLPENEGDPLLRLQSAIERFVHVPRHDLPDSVRANPTPEDMAWYAIFPEATVEIVDLTPGAEYMLGLLKSKDLPIVGSFSMVDWVESWPERKVDFGEPLGHVVGSLKINWFRYANTFVQGSQPEI